MRLNNDEYEKLTKLKKKIDQIEEMLKMFDPVDNRYRLRKLFFNKSKSKVTWGHSYGTDIKEFDLEREDTVALVEHFKQKLERLKLEFSGVEVNHSK